MNENDRLALNELEVSFEHPRLRLAEYFSRLKNSVDIEAMSQSPATHSSLIEQIELFEKKCFANLSTINYDSIHKSILDIESISRDEVEHFIYKTRMSLESELFGNECLMFLPLYFQLVWVNEYFSDKEICLIKLVIYFIWFFSFKTKINFIFSSKILDGHELIVDYSREAFRAECFAKKYRLSNRNDAKLLTISIDSLDLCDLSCKRLLSLNKHLFENLCNLRRINLMQNDFDCLDPAIFNGLSNLEEINLSDNQRLFQLDKHIFRGLGKLKKIVLWKNKLHALEPDLFSELSALKEMFLSGNTISAIDANAFKDLSNLTKLVIWETGLESLESNIFINLKALNEISLCKTRIASLDKDVFKGLVNLKIIDLSENQIASIHNDLFAELHGLAELILYGNQISFLQADAFKGMSNLVRIDLGANKLMSVDACVFRGLSKLVEINLAQNYFKDKYQISFAFSFNKLLKLKL